MSTTEARGAFELKEEYAQFVGRKVLFIILFLAGIALLAGVAAALGSANITPLRSTQRSWPGSFPATLRPPTS